MSGLDGVRTIVCPYDFTPACRQSLEASVELARKLDAELHVVHVVITPPMIVLTPSEGLPAPPIDQSAFRKEVEARRGPEIRSELERAGGAGVRTKIAFRDALNADLAIIEYAQAARAGLIVMAKHAKPALSRFLLGSTTERVLKHAPCAILVIPTAEAKGP